MYLGFRRIITRINTIPGNCRTGFGPSDVTMVEWFSGINTAPRSWCVRRRSMKKSALRFTSCGPLLRDIEYSLRWITGTACKQWTDSKVTKAVYGDRFRKSSRVFVSIFVSLLCIGVYYVVTSYVVAIVDVRVRRLIFNSTRTGAPKANRRVEQLSKIWALDFIVTRVILIGCKLLGFQI